MESVKNIESEELYFNYSATLRIFGNIPDIDVITKTLNLKPFMAHNKGQPRKNVSPALFDKAMWIYKSPVDKEQPPDAHIKDLCVKLKPHKKYLLELQKSFTVDIYCSYRSNSGTGGVVISPESLKMLAELNIPFGISVTIS